MDKKFSYDLIIHCSFLLLSMGIVGCFQGNMRVMNAVNNSISQPNNSYREPSLSRRWLVRLAKSQGREIVEMIDLRNRNKVPLPGLNRSDSQPISVSVSADGEILALIAHRADQTILFVYRRTIGTLQRIQLIPKGIPYRVSIDGSGKILAVQVSRGGRWEVDVIRLQG